MCLTACGSIQSVELPQQLPKVANHKHQQVIKQEHYLTQEDRDNELAKLNVLATKMQATMGDVNWKFMVDFEQPYVELIRLIVAKLETSSSVEDFEHYQHMFYECYTLLSKVSETYINERDTLNSLIEKYNAGEKNGKP